MDRRAFVKLVGSLPLLFGLDNPLRGSDRSVLADLLCDSDSLMPAERLALDDWQDIIQEHGSIRKIGPRELLVEGYIELPAITFALPVSIRGSSLDATIHCGEFPVRFEE